MYEYEPIPFYKAYPVEPFLDECKWMQKEKELFLSFLPKRWQIIQKAVESLCDKMEYEGSWIYHEYPYESRIGKYAKEIVLNLEDGNSKDDEDLVISFLCQEMLYRRYRFRRGKQFIK